MLESAEAEILRRLPDDALVLDVGGWAAPFWRADHVIDILPYESRGLYGAPPDPAKERFTEATWTVADICDRDPWPYDDDQFDFVLCSQTLEDLRDPVGVCREINRVGKAGYIEVPTRLAEQSAGVENDLPGWSHHHWICDLEDGGIAFTFKHHVVHWPKNHLPEAFGRALPLEQRLQGFFWTGSFPYRERILTDPFALEAELERTVAEHRHLIPEDRKPRRRPRWPTR